MREEWNPAVGGNHVEVSQDMHGQCPPQRPEQGTGKYWKISLKRSSWIKDIDPYI